MDDELLDAPAGPEELRAEERARQLQNDPATQAGWAAVWRDMANLPESSDEDEEPEPVTPEPEPEPPIDEPEAELRPQRPLVMEPDPEAGPVVVLRVAQRWLRRYR
eukprot:s4508_g4.t1